MLYHIPMKYFAINKKFASLYRACFIKQSGKSLNEKKNYVLYIADKSNPDIALDRVDYKGLSQTGLLITVYVEFMEETNLEVVFRYNNEDELFENNGLILIVREDGR